MRIFLNMRCQSKWYRNNEEEQYQDFGISKVVLVEAGDDKACQCCQCAESHPSGVIVAFPEPAQERSIKLDQEPQKRREAGKAAFRSDLEVVIMQVARIKPVKRLIRVVPRKIVMNAFRSDTNQRVCLDHLHPDIPIYGPGIVCGETF